MMKSDYDVDHASDKVREAMTHITFSLSHDVFEPARSGLLLQLLVMPEAQVYAAIWEEAHGVMHLVPYSNIRTVEA